MSEWDWITVEGAVGELPVRILPNQHAEFLDFVEGVMIEYESSVGDSLIPGDVCFLTAEIVDVGVDSHPARIRVDVQDVEFLQRPDTDDSEISEMMVYLDGARKRRNRERDEKQCGNCTTIDPSTRLSAESKIGNRDLHYCAACGRLMSSDEYEQWLDVNR